MTTSLKLEKDPRFAPPDGPVVVVVLDGVGLGRQDETDAVWLARTPTLDWLDQNALRTTLFAHGTHVGMPSDSDMGNSEVGHNALGAGRIFAQGATLVGEALASGRIFESDAWLEGVRRVREGDSTLHLMGLLSDGNVHSHIDHVFALVRRAAADGVRRLRVHALQDGRDVGAHTALDYLAPLEALLAELRQDGTRDYRIASGGGRMIVTMDRYEADWSIVERGWRAHVLGEGRGFASATEAIETLRRESPDISDQVLPPWVVVDAQGQPIGTIEDGDTVFFWNFRGDRALEITRAFEEATFSAFDRVRHPRVYYAGMMQYDGDLKLPSNFLVPPPAIDRPMGHYLAATGLRQLAVSETQKYGHVTYFWNGNRSGYIDRELETYIEIPSDRIDFSERPWMKAAEITDAAIEAMVRERPHFVRINYPNGDMVGHTGDCEAAVLAVQATDLCLRRLLEALRRLGGVAIVTADHGNADQMFQLDAKTGRVKRDAQGRPVAMTSHTLNPVPLWLLDWRGPQLPYRLDDTLEPRRLSNIAATAMQLMGYVPPADYDAPLIVPVTR